MRSSRFICIIVIIALIFCSNSSVFATSNVYVTNQGTSYYFSSRDNLNSGASTDIGGLISNAVHFLGFIVQRIGDRTDDGLGVNGQLSNIRSMLYSIMQNVINYLGPVTTPSGSKSINELSYMIWSAITALGPSVDGIYTNSSLILTQEQNANSTLTSIHSQNQTQTTHLANIRQTTSLMRDDINNINWTSVNLSNVSYSSDGTNFVSTIPAGSYKDIYIKFNRTYLTNPSLVRIDVPFRLAPNIYTDLSKINLSIRYGNNYSYITNYYAFSYFLGLSFILDPFDFTGNDGNYDTIIHIACTSQSLMPTNVNNLHVYYMNNTIDDYYTISNFILNNKRNEILDSYSAKFDHLSNLDSDLDNIITILDKSTSIVQNDNEVNINTNISIDEVDFVNSGVRRFKQFFNTGITAAAFGIALDTYVYDQFFHQEVTDLVQTVNSEYTEVPLVINTWPII